MDDPHVTDWPNRANCREARSRGGASAKEGNRHGVWPGKLLGGEPDGSAGSNLGQVGAVEHGDRRTGALVHENDDRLDRGEIPGWVLGGHRRDLQANRPERGSVGWHEKGKAVRCRDVGAQRNDRVPAREREKGVPRRLDRLRHRGCTPDVGSTEDS